MQLKRAKSAKSLSMQTVTPSEWPRTPQLMLKHSIGSLRRRHEAASGLKSNASRPRTLLVLPLNTFADK
jgi:hypothetical protein